MLDQRRRCGSAGLRAGRKGQHGAIDAARPVALSAASWPPCRSLLAPDNPTAAIKAVLAAPGTLRQAFIAADPQALTIAEMIAAMRHGVGRRPNVFPFPAALLGLVLRAGGREEIHQRLSGSLIADPSASMNLGWATPAGLAGLLRGAGREERSNACPRVRTFATMTRNCSLSCFSGVTLTTTPMFTIPSRTPRPIIDCDVRDMDHIAGRSARRRVMQEGPKE
jgi:hypothetical protein